MFEPRTGLNHECTINKRGPGPHGAYSLMKANHEQIISTVTSATKGKLWGWLEPIYPGKPINQSSVNWGSDLKN